MTDVLKEYDDAMRLLQTPRVPLEVYTSNSWRRVGVKGDYLTVMQPVVARDGHPDISGTDALNAMVAAFNAMLKLRPTLETTTGPTEAEMKGFDEYIANVSERRIKEADADERGPCTCKWDAAMCVFHN